MRLTRLKYTDALTLHVFIQIVMLFYEPDRCLTALCLLLKYNRDAACSRLATLLVYYSELLLWK